MPFLLSGLLKTKKPKNSLTTPPIIDICNTAFKGGEIYKIAIKGLEKEVMKRFYCF
jgi:hypothetical protein